MFRPPFRRPLSKAEKWLFGVASAAILGLAGIAVFSARINAAPAIVFPAPPALPKPNGFDVYLAAAGAIVSATPAVDAVNDAQDLQRTNPALAARNYSLARRNAWLQSNPAGFALFEKAQTLPCLPPLYQAKLGTANYMALRQLARQKIVEANTRKLRGDWNGAVASALDILQMGSDMGNGAPLAPRMVGSAIVAMGRDPLTSPDDPISKLSAPQTRAATKRLEAVWKRRSSFLEALKVQKWTDLREFVRVTRIPDWRAQITQGREWREQLRVRFVSQFKVAANIARLDDEVIANFQRPYSAPWTVEEGDFLTELLASSYDKRFHEGSEVVTLHILLLRFALRAYRLEHGAFPRDLNRLAPQYLQKIPTDYFADGAPFHYSLQGNAYRLYSVGPDGKDDGGTPIPWRDGKIGLNRYGRFPPLLLDSKGDYVAGNNR